jgi:hypothetical protein
MRVDDFVWMGNTQANSSKNGDRIRNGLATAYTAIVTYHEVIHPLEDTSSDVLIHILGISKECLKGYEFSRAHREDIIGSVTGHNLSLDVWVIVNRSEHIDILDYGHLIVEDADYSIISDLTCTRSTW